MGTIIPIALIAGVGLAVVAAEDGAPAAAAQRTRVEANPAQVRELELWAANTARLNNQRESIIKNLVRKKRRGVYDHELAVKLWRYWTDAAAKDYQHEFGGSQIFSTADRDAAARTFRDEFEVEYDLGNYEHMVPVSKSRRK